ncbi:unnamed protein product [Nippostrongylus brasiliensis]|uniref:Coiled-coil domain-containing protein 134 n=1 Tax=Nippostrongylus brasiliensis TaxID=27835 RepID=A0A0N4YMB1_NIPBR|nr:unnamed protein product [Nippostrongylus brasiliensis]
MLSLIMRANWTTSCSWCCYDQLSDPLLITSLRPHPGGLFAMLITKLTSDTELFKAKRREQQVLVELIVKNKESKRRQLVEEAVKNAQQILEESRETLERIGHRATDSFPHSNDVLKSAISKVLENIAFFSEISLRFPFLEKTMQKNRKLRTVVIWAYTYAKESGLCDMDTNRVLDMMAQQHEIIPKSEKFINSYDKENAKKELEERLLQEQQRRAKVKSQHMKPVKQKFHSKMEL